MKSFHRLRARRLLLVFGGVLLTAWLVPPYFHASRYRRVLQAALEGSLGRRMELGAVSFRLLPHPGFSIDHVVIRENSRFGSEPFARVDRVECNLRWRSIWGSRLDCARIILEHPVLNLVRNRQGEWNVQDFLLRTHTAARFRSTRQPAPSQAGFDLDVDDARLDFTSGITKEPFTITGLSGGLTLNPNSGLVRFEFAGTPLRVDLPQPAPGLVELTGEWRPGSNFTGPFRATLRTSNSLLYGWVPLLTGRNPELYGLVDATVRIAGSINRLGVTGDIRLDQLHRCDALPPLSSMPVNLSFGGSLDRVQRQFLVRRADISFADSHIRLSGAVDYIGASPRLDFVLGADRTQLQDVVALAARLSGRQAAWDASGLVDGLLTIQGSWRRRRYGGFIALHSAQIGIRGISFPVAQAAVRIDRQGAHLLPVHFSPAPRVECVAEGALLRAQPMNALRGAAWDRDSGFGKSGSARPGLPASGDRYEMSITSRQSPVREIVRLARKLGAVNTRKIDAEGVADATLQIAGRAWPFRMPNFSARVDLHHGRLLIPGLTEPLRLAEFRLEAHGRDVRVQPLVAQMGPVKFSGWLKHDGSHGVPWRFDVTAPKLSLEEASLWFAVLGHKKPVPILDLIPGLRSLVARREAGRSIFASVNARGRLQCRLVTFRTVRLKNVHARLSITGREATVGDAGFRVADGAGGGSAVIDFRRVPALITGKFQLSGGKLARIAWRLPPALRGVRGRISATGHFTTRGLTRQEMSADLLGEARLQLADVSLGGFDPVQAFARAATLGPLRLQPGEARFPLASLDLQIHGQRVVLAPLPLDIGMAWFRIHGMYGFDGRANVYVQADLTRVRRQWVRVRQDGLAAGQPPWSVASGADTLAGALLTRGNSPELKEIHSPGESLPDLRPPRVDLPGVHLAGAVNALAIVKPAAANSRP